MTLVTVFRHVPPPIIGTVGVLQQRRFTEFEERLDWLEAIGILVERFDPSTAYAEVAARGTVRALLSRDGERCLPLLLVDDAVVSCGVYPSRTQLARIVGQAQGRVAQGVGEPGRDAAVLAARRH